MTTETQQRENEELWERYEKNRRRNQPSRRTLEFLGNTIAPRVTRAAEPVTPEGRKANMVANSIATNWRHLPWFKWLKLRWRIERLLLRALIDDLNARGVPQNVIAAGLQISPVTVSAWINHRDERHYLTKHAERVEEQILAVLEQCPESKLYKGGSGRVPRRDFEKLEKAVLDKIRFALADSPELYEELKTYL